MISHHEPAQWRPDYPKQLILKTSDLMLQFEQQVQGLGLTSWDMHDIAMQVLDLLLNFGPTASQSFPLLPDWSRLTDPTLEEDPVKAGRLKHAAMQLAAGMQARVDEIKAYRRHANGEDFPYFFSRWHGRDLLLDHMPF